MKPSRVFIVILSLIAIMVLLGCPATSTKLASLKAEYNAGHYDRVLDANGTDSHSAPQVIAEAQINDDVLTENQAKLIMARALVSKNIGKQLINRKDLCESKDVTKAISMVRSLKGDQLPFEWMRIEAAAMVADVHQICGRKGPAFMAYDYMLTHNDFTDIPSVLQRYMVRWAESYYLAADRPIYQSLVEKQFEKTLKFLRNKYPNNSALIYADLMQKLHEGQIVAAVQFAMLSRAYVLSGSIEGKELLNRIDKRICDVLTQNKKDTQQYYLYKKFLKQWEEKDYSCPGIK